MLLTFAFCAKAFSTKARYMSLLYLSSLFKREFVAIGLVGRDTRFFTVEDCVGFLNCSKTATVFGSIWRESGLRGPLFGGRWLYCDSREWGSMTMVDVNHKFLHKTFRSRDMILIYYVITTYAVGYVMIRINSIY